MRRSLSAPAPDSPYVGVFGKVLDDGTPYMSPGQISQISICGARWAGPYLWNEPRYDNANFVFGNAVHAALEYGLEAELNGQGRLTEGAIVAMALKDYYERVKALDMNLVAVKDRADLSDPEFLEEWGEKAAECARLLWVWWVESGLKVEGVEERGIRRFTVPDPRDDGTHEVAVMGYYDVLARDALGHLVLVDWKTAGRAPTFDKDLERFVMDRKHAHALLSYVDGIHAAQPDEEVARIVTVTVTKAKAPRVCEASLDVTEAMLEWSRQVSMGGFRKALVGDTAPNPFGAGNLCSEAFCDRWGRCVGSPSSVAA